jgi:hypothetical protein
MPIIAAMRIIPCRLSNGQRIPVLFRDTPPQPVLLPFLYLALKRQYKAYNTMRNDLVTIKALYDFFALDGIDVDEVLIDGQFAILLTRVEQFLAWLTTGKIAHNVVGRLGGVEPINHYGIDPVTRDGYVRSLKSYLLWCVDRYGRSTSVKEISTRLSTSSSASSTLVGRRGEKIDAARAAQLKASGSYDDGKRRRLLLEDQNEILKKKVEELQDARNHYVEQLLTIVQQLQSKGVNIEESLVVLRPNRL